MFRLVLFPVKILYTCPFSSKLILLCFTTLQVSLDASVAMKTQDTNELVIPPALASVRARVSPLKLFIMSSFGIRVAVSHNVKLLNA